jgi:thioester reductase-like protein
LSLTRTAEAQLIFCSSISAALGTQPNVTIPSAPLESLQHASPTGYGKSKLGAERIIQNGVEEYGVRCTILRIGQIVPSRVVGRNKLWSPNEMIPLVVRSANIIGCLPDRVGGGGCEWLEVEVVTKFVMDVCGFETKAPNDRDEVNKCLVYNVAHPKSFSWNEDFLSLLRDAGMVLRLWSIYSG